MNVLELFTFPPNDFFKIVTLVVVRHAEDVLPNLTGEQIKYPICSRCQLPNKANSSSIYGQCGRYEQKYEIEINATSIEMSLLVIFSEYAR